MSRQEFLSATGRLTGQQLIQPSEITMHKLINNNTHTPPMTNYLSGNYIGGQKLYQVNKNIDINGLHQPSGVNPVIDKQYISNITGITPPDKKISGGAITSLNKTKLKNIPVTSKYNLIGFSDPRQLGIYNDTLYIPKKNGAPVGSQNYRIEQARGKYTTFGAGIKSGGLARKR